eukprot:9498273-Pyramimonas_sp.AAC.1
MVTRQLPWPPGIAHGLVTSLWARQSCVVQIPHSVWTPSFAQQMSRALARKIRSRHHARLYVVLGVSFAAREAY